jgi:O-antigen/teichoic acid export membrane protein
MMVLGAQMPLAGIDTMLGTAVFALHRERAWLRVGVIAAIFNPAACLVFIPLSERILHNGAVSAAVITAATELLMFVGALKTLPAGTIDRRTWALGARVIVAGICVALVARAVAGSSLPLAVIAGVFTYATLTIILKLITPSDFRGLSEAMPQPWRHRLGTSRAVASQTMSPPEA